MRTGREGWALLASGAILIAACSSSRGSHESGSDDSGAYDAGGLGSDGRAETDAPPGGSGSDAADGGGQMGAGADASGDAGRADATADGGAPDAGGDDAAIPTEASTDSGPCSPSELWCGGLCVPNDFVNCGSCGNDCTNLRATSTPSCSAGQCTFPGLTCATGWAHCTSNESDGCESDLSQPAHCGSCGVQCVASPICAMSAGAFSCSKAVAVAEGYDFTLAVLSNGSVQSWGNNWGGYEAEGDGQLGNGTNEEGSSKPGPVSSTSTTVSVAAGDGHACALLSDGTVECWGDNSWGQLGTDPETDASITNSLTPLAVAGLGNVVAIAVGAVHSCALISGGTVECWGSNDHGELGNDTSALCNGSDMCSATPAPVSGLSNVTAISVGDDAGNGADHTCALLASGTVECWGYNSDGELGNGTATAQSPYGIATPGPVSGLTNVTAITALNEGGCALLSGGGVECWGDNDNGELGDGTTNASLTPVAVSNLTDAVALSVGSTANCVCAVRSNGTGVCWGQNGNGELGAGSSAPESSATPLAVSGLTNIVAIATGTVNTCALLATGDMECWGFNGDGELANAAADPNDNPAPLPVQW
ncbi:MAG: hypothetical protein ACLP1X_13225 [Polyangiaceae bacterium]